MAANHQAFGSKNSLLSGMFLRVHVSGQEIRDQILLAKTPRSFGQMDENFWDEPPTVKGSFHIPSKL